MDESAVFKLEVTDVQGDRVTFNLRIRGEHRWLFYRGIVINKSDGLVIHDGQKVECFPAPAMIEVYPRSFVND